MDFHKVTAFAAVVALMVAATSQAHLSPSFYANSCRLLPLIVEKEVSKALRTDNRAASKLIHLHFHDCFANGCDGSVLLEDVPGVIDSELNALPNEGIQGLEIVDNIKAAVERFCPSTVSCADILTISSQISVQLSGGPFWLLEMGRKDSRIANREAATNLPSPFHTLDEQKAQFAAFGFDSTELVALSGAHSFGRARCQFFDGRLNNFNGTSQPDPTMDSSYRSQLLQACTNSTTRVSFDPTTPNKFDNNYFSDLENHRGLLQTDQQLFSTPGADTAAIVNSFANNQGLFLDHFVMAMIKMDALMPPSGTPSEVRLNCRKINA